MVSKLKKTYLVSLEPETNSLEEYEKRDQNIVRVRVQLPSGEVVASSQYRLELSLSRDAMIGLGTELIRLALKQEEISGIFHLRPMEKNFASEVLGIYLHPDSCELLVAHNEFGTIEEVFDNYQSLKDNRLHDVDNKTDS